MIGDMLRSLMDIGTPARAGTCSSSRSTQRGLSICETVPPASLRGQPTVEPNFDSRRGWSSRAPACCLAVSVLQPSTTSLPSSFDSLSLPLSQAAELERLTGQAGRRCMEDGERLGTRLP